MRALATEAESIVRRLGDDAALLRVLNLTFLPLWVPDDFNRSVERAHEAQALAERVRRSRRPVPSRREPCAPHGLER